LELGAAENKVVHRHAPFSLSSSSNYLRFPSPHYTVLLSSRFIDMSRPSSEGDAKDDHERVYEYNSEIARWVAEVVMNWNHPLFEAYMRWRRAANRVLRDPPHRYKALKSPRSLRLFRIFDFDLEAKEIIGCFFEEELDRPVSSWSSNFRYTTLSYTWESAIKGVDEIKPEHPWTIVVCNGITRANGAIGTGTDSFSTTSISIGQNAAAYLIAVISAHIRKNVPLAYEVWLDSVCIDQGNEAEQQAQILLMGDIYAKAGDVHAWLGAEEEGWEAFSWIHSVLLQGLERFYRDKGEGCWEVMSAYDPTRIDFWVRYFPSLQPPSGSWLECWESYWRFLSKRRWFKRAWTYQEALLAGDLIIVCGENLETMPYSKVGRMTFFLHKSNWRRTLDTRFFQGYDTPGNPNRLIFAMYEARNCVSECIKRRPTSLSSEDTPKIMSEEEWISFWRIVCSSLRFRACSRAEDKIRASLGIATILRPPEVQEELFKETNGLSTREIYRWASALFLRRGLNLDHLSEVGPGYMEGLPMWAADFSTEINFEAVTHAKHFNASYLPGTAMKGQIDIDSGILRAVGMKVGMVRSTGGFGDRSLPEWFLHHLCGQPPIYALTAPQCSLEALWRTLIWDCDSQFRPADEAGGRDSRSISRVNSCSSTSSPAIGWRETATIRATKAGG
jgi:hypothetical protein